MVRLMKWRIQRDGKIIIDPIKASTGDSIMWDARNTRQPLALFFTDGALFGTHQTTVRPGKTKTMRIRSRGREWAIYTYAAYFVEHRRFGEGSTPIIIVKP